MAKPKTTVRPSGGKGNRAPRIDSDVAGQLGGGARTPRSVVVASNSESRRSPPTYSFRYLDSGFCSDGTLGEHASEIVRFLRDLGGSTWHDLEEQRCETGFKHHAMAFDDVTHEARSRLSDLRLDEVFEDLFRFRLAGRKRLWGFRREGVFYALWWDPEHVVYPVRKRHT